MPRSRFDFIFPRLSHSCPSFFSFLFFSSPHVPVFQPLCLSLPSLPPSFGLTPALSSLLCSSFSHPWSVWLLTAQGASLSCPPLRLSRLSHLAVQHFSPQTSVFPPFAACGVTLSSFPFLFILWTPSPLHSWPQYIPCLSEFLTIISFLHAPGYPYLSLIASFSLPVLHFPPLPTLGPQFPICTNWYQGLTHA